MKRFWIGLGVILLSINTVSAQPPGGGCDPDNPTEECLDDYDNEEVPLDEPVVVLVGITALLSTVILSGKIMPAGAKASR